MTEAANLVQLNHKRQLRVALGVSIFALLLSFAPRHERALFVVRDPVITAFSAIVPAPLLPDLGKYLVTVLNPFTRTRLFARPGTVGETPSPFVAGTPVVPQSSLTEPVAPPTFGATSATSPTLTDPASFLPAVPLSFGPPGTSPVGPIDTIPGVTVVLPVPEPTTWMTMVLGFLGVGTLLRLRRLQLFEPRSVAFKGDRVKA